MGHSSLLEDILVYSSPWQHLPTSPSSHSIWFINTSRKPEQTWKHRKTTNRLHKTVIHRYIIPPTDIDLQNLLWIFEENSQRNQLSLDRNVLQVTQWNSLRTLGCRINPWIFTSRSTFRRAMRWNRWVNCIYRYDLLDTKTEKVYEQNDTYGLVKGCNMW